MAKDLEEKQHEIEQRTEELDRREHALTQRERDLERRQAILERRLSGSVIGGTAITITSGDPFATPETGAPLIEKALSELHARVDELHTTFSEEKRRAEIREEELKSAMNKMNEETVKKQNKRRSWWKRP